MSGSFITFEGIEGSGKSTVARAVYEAFRRAGIPALLTREPGGTRISEGIRSMVLDPDATEICPKAELLLYLASRAQLVQETIEPALQKGQVVLCDRFMDASVAYQGWARGLGEKLVGDLNAFAVGQTVPGITFLLDLPVAEGFRRGPERREGERRSARDRLEREEQSFHEKVREGYLRLAEKNGDRFVVIDASKPVDEVITEVLRNIEARLNVNIL
ncbi:MAG: dTMP kinase [bacterium]|nr:MAG: dTMP kinase [bacterium]